MKAYFHKTRWLYLISTIIILLDQISKHFVRTKLAVGESWTPWPWLEPFARIVHWTNTGVAFGMFQGNNLAFSILAATVAAAIIYYYPRIPEEDRILRFALGMQLGGALGNLIDRVTIHQVTDFISVGNFAVFNVADSCITVGVFVLLLGVYFEDKREKEKKRLEAITPPPADEGEEIKSWPNL